MCGSAPLSKSERLDVRIGVVVDELAAVAGHRFRGAQLGDLVVSDDNGENVPARLQVLDVTTGVVAVIAGEILESPKQPAPKAVDGTFEIEASSILVAVENLVGVRPEADLRETLNRTLDRLVVLEEAHYEAAGIGEAPGCGGAAQLVPDPRPSQDPRSEPTFSRATLQRLLEKRKAPQRRGFGESG
jgi:hypothetical protein